MSIDDATPEEWNNLKLNTVIADAWNKTEEWEGTNDHPLYGDKFVHDVHSIESAPDMVDNPEHYNNGDIECIDAIEAMLTPDEFVGYLRGNSLKYRWRFRYKKKPIEDLRKARWYEERLLKFLMENQDVLG
jgi:hypothetical protein